ncbi:MAG TPA: alpha/beta hydrolase family protein [Aliidongia sp.]|uniref:alpha/beta hydrolase n=1 Tax=Aliidongia sp. TaxID=1914230 RepID=UPI002DDD766D|nr:alpha/beta hydrolase family protein [Aliidongia sp.]HEV2674333.1 alpha/beta hydrolase family protein [Aliidongia sp.]
MRALLAVLLALVAVPALAAQPSQILRTAEAPSPALGHPLGFVLYLPPGYDGTQARLPVIYLLHGAQASAIDWVDQGHLREIADRLIASHRLPPTIIVMPEGGPNSWYMDAPGDGSGNVATAIEQDLPAYVERTWRARTDRRGRAIAGYSMGGYGALRFALMAPERYAAAAAMSGAFWTQVTPETRFDDRIQHIFEGAFGRPFDARRFVAANPMTLAGSVSHDGAMPAIYLTCGRGDRYHLDQEQATMARRLAAMRIPVETALTPGDHDWETWSGALPAVLQFLARPFAAAPKS